MSAFYTQDMAVFVQELRDAGYSWVQVEKEFEKEFGEKRSYEAIRCGIRRLLTESLQDEDDEEIIPLPEHHKDVLPKYLLYAPEQIKIKVTPRKEGTVLFLTDAHIPYHDQKALALIKKVAQDIPDLVEIVIGGDWADYYAINSHGKHPDFQHLLVSEINQVRKELEDLRKLFPIAKITYIEGNHEFRLQRYIYNNAKDLHGLVDSPSLFCLNDLGIDWVPYDADQRHQILESKLYARHEPIGGGVHAASSTVDKAGCSMIFFHVHRMQMYRKVMIDGTDHVAACFGWLGNKNHPVMRYLKNHAQWQLGAGLAHILKDGTFHLQPLQIINYSTVYNGKVYKI